MNSDKQNKGKRIAESSATLLVGSTANKITGFLIMLTVARLLGDERFGLYTAVFAYVSVFSLVTDLGLTTVVTRRLIQDEEDGRRWLGNALLIRWPLAAGSFIACVGSAFVLYGASERTSLIAISSLSFLLSPLTTHVAVFHRQLLLRIPALVSLLTRLVLLVLVQWLARHSGTLAALVGVEVVVGVVTNVSLWLWSRAIARPIWQFDRDIARSVVRDGIPLFLASAFVTLYFRIDVFFIDHYRNPSEIGIYAAAYRFTESMPMIASALATSIFPVLCQQVHTANEQSVTKLIRISLKVLLGMIIALAIVIAFYSNAVIAVLYGGRFSGAAPLLSILAFNQILVYTNILMTTLLVARGQNRTLMNLTFGMLLWNIALNFAVIPRYGALGAAWTTMATELAGTIGCLVLTSTWRVFLQIVSRFAIPAAVCASLLALLSPQQVELTPNSLWPVAAVLLAYALTVALLRVFDPEERERLRKLAWQ